MVLTVINFAILCSILYIVDCSSKKEEENQQTLDQYRQVLIATDKASTNVTMLQSAYDTYKEVVERWASILANGRDHLGDENFDFAANSHSNCISELQETEKCLYVARQNYEDCKLKENNLKQNIWSNCNS